MVGSICILSLCHGCKFLHWQRSRATDKLSSTLCAACCGLLLGSFSRSWSKQGPACGVPYREARARFLEPDSPIQVTRGGKPELPLWMALSQRLFPNSSWADTWWTWFQLGSRFHLIHRASELHGDQMRSRRDCRCLLRCSWATNSKVSLISVRNLAGSLFIKWFHCIGFW